MTLLLALACHKAATPTPDPLTPEDAVAHATVGAVVTVKGTVFSMTFDSGAAGDTGSINDGGSGYVRRGDRWLLVRTVTPPGVALGSTFDVTALDAAWGLGIRLTADQLAAHAFPMPQNGDDVTVTGTFALDDWNGHSLPMIEEVTALSTSGTPLGAVGTACKVDATCADDLVCDRTLLQCQPPPAGTVWGSDWHDVNGACDSDDDCPAAQHCDLGYAMVPTGTYAPQHHTSDVGRHLCVLDSASLADNCPIVHTTQDLVGGRFAEGKELCVSGQVMHVTPAADGDTHEQLFVTEPLPFPKADAPYYVFGGTSENSPPSKDPARPGGALADPPDATMVTVIGTYRYDQGHGWFEIHPNKAYWIQ